MKKRTSSQYLVFCWVCVPLHLIQMGMILWIYRWYLLHIHEWYIHMYKRKNGIFKVFISIRFDDTYKTQYQFWSTPTTHSLLPSSHSYHVYSGIVLNSCVSIKITPHIHTHPQKANNRANFYNPLLMTWDLLYTPPQCQ